MASITTKPDSLQLEAETAPYLLDDWFDPIEAGPLAMKKELASWGIATEAGSDH